jgi:hypothetical protein
MTVEFEGSLTFLQHKGIFFQPLANEIPHDNLERKHDGHSKYGGDDEAGAEDAGEDGAGAAGA